MNIVADIGNTCVKLGLYNRDELIINDSFSLNDIDQINDFLNRKKADRAIISSVVTESQAVTDSLKNKVPFVLEYDAQTKISVKNLYKTPDTLGNDRIPPVIAAQQEQPGIPILVIDAGTCIKYNFLNKEGEFIGGAISPGLNMRFKALNTFTSRLPLIESDIDFNNLVGTDSRESILAGVQTAAIAEVNELVNQYKLKYPGLNVFLTGGDLAFFEKRIKYPIFVSPNLVLKGLNIILNYNA